MSPLRSNDTYFSDYANVSTHGTMLRDKPRMTFYQECIESTVKGKTVLDVGAGTGILSLMAARAGATKVYAVEASGFAEVARSVVEANGYAHIIQVIESRVEDVTLPEKVDVIISEWMGFYLVHESMFPSVIDARDKWLKPGGLMIPERAEIIASPVSLERWRDENIGVWKNVSGFDFSGVLDRVVAELTTEPLVLILKEDEVIAPPEILATIDLAKATKDEVVSFEATIAFRSYPPSVQGKKRSFGGFALWFSVYTGDRVLPTGPMDPPTHWMQTVVPLAVADDFPLGSEEDGTEIEVTISINQAADNPRQYTIDCSL